MKKIILTGYMGSGKSTIAQLLHKKTGIKAIDLDEFIAEKAKMPVAEIFREKGEIHFRKLEHDHFNALMRSEENMILSLGGGTPCYADNHKLLNGNGVVSFYLKASVGHLYERILSNENERPLVAGKNTDEMREFIAKHLFDRSFYYNQATYKIITDDKKPAEIVSEIQELLA